jgi:UDP-N-acetylglucosamine--N-acetylmuramyl-(pentapeptide) pyrophosphoryl-undecaprenol N-acetylglucosamine transferase
VNALGRSVLIMAGGTGGHIFPGLAVAGVFRERGVDVRWLGAEGGMECRQVPAHGYELDSVRISGVRGKGLAGWLSLPFRLLRAVRDAGASLAADRPRCALSFGGYAAGPGGIAARLRGIPLVVHEQNRVPGLTNRILARFARVVLQAFPGTFPDRVGAVTCGNPVRESVASLPGPELRFFQRRNRPRLLVTGGSQGAQSLNRVVPAAIALLPAESRPLVCHQAGKGHADSTCRAYEKAGVEAEVHEFIDDIAGAYEWADLAICRAGALTVSELAAAGLGAILVPYPHAVDDHQTRNAGFLEEAGAASILPESRLSAASLAGLLGHLLADRVMMLEMARRARSVAVADAAERVAAACEQWVGA